MVRTPLTDAQIQAISVGRDSRHDGTVELQPYDSRWSSQYSVLAAKVRAALGNRVLALEHVGSTAVPGLSAKPVIDPVLTVADSAEETAYMPILERAGFVLVIREPNWQQHRMFGCPKIAGNMHVFSHGCGEIGRMVKFCDWLRANGGDRALYERAKQDLASREWKYIQNYADAKCAIVSEIMARVLAGPSDAPNDGH